MSLAAVERRVGVVEGWGVGGEGSQEVRVGLGREGGSVAAVAWFGTNRLRSEHMALIRTLHFYVYTRISSLMYFQRSI